MSESRQTSIHDKGFNLFLDPRERDNNLLQFRSIQLGNKKIDDATLQLDTLKRQTGHKFADKRHVLKALAENDPIALREISNYYYRVSGIYQKICNYFSTIYRYDWYVVPEIFDTKIKKETVIKDFISVLSYLDTSRIVSTCQNIALKVIRDGVYYGYMNEDPTGISIQELPIKYCRNRYNIGAKPAVEFDMRFFDDYFPNAGYREKILKLFPKEFTIGYRLFKQKKLMPDTYIDDNLYGSWYLLDPEKSMKFSINNSETPLFVNAIPAILDLDAAQALDRKKQMQKLMKILVQKLPLDKNGDLIFDVDEAQDIHNNAVQMLANAIGVDVLTTFADIDAINTSDSNTTTTKDDLEKVERTVFNALGVSRNLFNTDGNLSLEKSLLTDAGSVRSLLSQLEIFYDTIIRQFNSKKYKFRLYMLETTQYNYMELSKMYKEQVQMGYSKMLPQIALGHSQSSIINTAYFENEVLQLSSIMIPPLTSSTMSGQDLLSITSKEKENNNNKSTKVLDTSDSKSGRPQLSDDQKSQKTIQNQESQS